MLKSFQRSQYQKARPAVPLTMLSPREVYVFLSQKFSGSIFFGR
ncbi:MAG: hypothetical protein QNJ41_27080 [Xenococcaceae cyanobacterium MO_188.B32]|nr:hypothetical protein [Xenococcaceae cyanobacterium MO_188.B32]